MRSTIVAALIISMASLTEARTWRVNPAGTGDAPTLHAAMDSAVAGDIVLAEAGHYVLPSDILPSHLNVPPGVQLIGESGPAFTLISRDAFAEPGTIGLNNSRISGIHVQGNTWPVLGVVNGAIAENCIIEALPGGGLVSGTDYLEFRNCLLLGGEGSGCPQDSLPVSL